MPEKRKDAKGRILKDGESQRKNGSYDFRYTDAHGKRRSVYAKTLEELREKEREIQRDLDDGIDYAAGMVTVIDLIERYLTHRQSVRYNTRVNYGFVTNLMKKEEFSCRQIKTIKPSDGKAFFIKLHNDGRSYSTITTVRGVLRPAFDMAVEDDIIRRNPFSFRVVDVVPNDTVTRKALTPAQKESFLAYLLDDKCRSRYYDEVVVLLGTGLRISELCGLTKSDIDFERRRIRVSKQLTRTRHTGSCEYYIEKPKTESGERYIPMLDDAVYQAFRRIIQKRTEPKVEYIIDGYTGFLFLDKDNKPKVAGHLEHALKRIVNHYNESHADKLIVSPHVLRHTFCTDMIAAGMDLKSLQYLMGHADAYTTANVYAHCDYDMAEKALAKIVQNR